MSVKSSNSLGVVARAFDLLATLAGSIEEVIRCFQRIVDDPVYRRQVWLAMTGKSIVTEMTKEEWIEREAAALTHFFPEDQRFIMDKLVEKMADTLDFGINQYCVPAGLDRKQLIEIARKVGMKINSSPHCDGQEIPTEAGLLECDLSAMMNATDSDNRPFNLNADEHKAWAAEQGGDGLTSAEETLYLMIRHFMTFGRILFMGGWIRCRNWHHDGESLFVGFFATDGLYVYHVDPSFRDWSSGAIARKFHPLAPGV
jgi:hypothetical protein